MAPQACDVVIYSRWADIVSPGELSVGAAGDDLAEDGFFERRFLLPVSRTECLSTEGPVAVLA